MLMTLTDFCPYLWKNTKDLTGHQISGRKSATSRHYVKHFATDHELGTGMFPFSTCRVNAQREYIILAPQLALGLQNHSLSHRMPRLSWKQMCEHRGFFKHLGRDEERLHRIPESDSDWLRATNVAMVSGHLTSWSIYLYHHLTPFTSKTPL